MDYDLAAPVFQVDALWYFHGFCDDLLGPYGDQAGAVEKYWLYRACVIDAPTCHHL